VKTVSAELDETGEKWFAVVKKDMGLLADADVLRVLISNAYHKLAEGPKRIWVPKELYELVEREAKREGKTVEDLVCEIVKEYTKEERKV